ncbi:DUF1681 domain-containing protein [Cephalotus follicularis]|uniref:DUF1681 domain-containing protein n=1 Tax=Cephalotus follicularis TaxID=3775 RepID=A0A1Q3D6D9_CEPFO|nr:DUF1681 domain-containing protein [Cephalotus follicularis]
MSSSTTLEDEESMEHTLLVVREESVYKIPPRSTSGGYKCGESLQSDKIQSGRVQVVSCGERCEIRLEDPNFGEQFTACFMKPGQCEAAVESVLRSCRYFMLRIKGGSGKHPFIGLGFAESNEALDFNVALLDHEKHVRRENEEFSGDSGCNIPDPSPLIAQSELQEPVALCGGEPLHLLASLTNDNICH